MAALRKYFEHITNFSFLFLVNVVIAALIWLTQVKLANSLGRDLFGQVNLGLVIGTFGQVIIRLGLDRTLVRDLTHYPERFANLLKASLYLRYILTLVVLLGMIAWKKLNTNASIGWGVILVGMATAILSLDLQAVYDVWNSFRRHAVYYLIQKASYLLMIWSVILFFGDLLSVLLVGIFLFISVGLYLIIQHRWVMQRVSQGNVDFHKILSEMLWLLRHNWMMWLTAILAIIIMMLNQLFIKMYCGFAELGTYAVAWQFVTVGTLLTEQVSRIGRPAMARITQPGISEDEQISFLFKYLFGMTVIVLPVALAMIVFPNLILKIMFRTEYQAASMILPLLGIYLFIFSIGMVVSQYVINMRFERTYFFSVFAGSIISVFLCQTLIPRFQNVGAAWTVLISHGTTILLYSCGVLIYLGRNRKKCLV